MAVVTDPELLPPDGPDWHDTAITVLTVVAGIAFGFAVGVAR